MENNICEVLALFKSASFGLNFQLLRVFIACVIDFIYYEFFDMFSFMFIVKFYIWKWILSCSKILIYLVM